MTGDQKLMDSNFIRAQTAPIAVFLIFQNLYELHHIYFLKNYGLRNS